VLSLHPAQQTSPAPGADTITIPRQALDYLYAAMAEAEIMANDPDLSDTELDKAWNELVAQDPDQRWFFTEVRWSSPGVTFFWNVEEQTLCLLGVRLKDGPGR
jgi:hypothetical protein